MKLWKVVGYIFAVLGILLLTYGFFVAFTETINPSAIFSGSTDGSLNSSIDSFFSVFLSAIAPWLILSCVMFAISGVGLYIGRDQKTTKIPFDEETINVRLEELERTVARNYEAISNRLQSIEERLKDRSEKSGN